MNARKRLIRQVQAGKKAASNNTGKVRKMFGHEHLFNENTGKWERIK